jgi:hypothetical protein
MSEDLEEKANAEARVRRDAYLAGVVPVSTDAPVVEVEPEAPEEPEVKELNDFTEVEENADV